MSIPERPAPARLTPRQREIVGAARAMLQNTSWAELGLRALAERIGIRAPSLYKHVSSKDHVRVLLLTEALYAIGDAMHAAAPGGVAEVLAAYRRVALAEPELYRLATQGAFPAEVPTALDAWAGTPFWLVTRDPQRAQALWALAHGLVTLEMDRRFVPGSDLDATYAAAAAAWDEAPGASPGGERTLDA